MKVRFVTFGGIGKKMTIVWRPWYEGETEFPNWKQGPTIDEFCDDAANQGWTLHQFDVAQGAPHWRLTAMFVRSSDTSA